jgi:hypothetical protein
MTRNKCKPRAVFDFVRTTEAVWRDPKTGTLLAPGATQNWPTREIERWILTETKRVKLEKRKNPVTDGHSFYVPVA